jgi:hypothetical protein
VEELELELVLLASDEAALEHGRTDQSSSLEGTVERAAVVEAVEQHRTIVLRLARGPSLHVVVLGLEKQLAVLEVVDAVDHLGAVDRPEVSDLPPLELPDLHVDPSFARAR